MDQKLKTGKPDNTNTENTNDFDDKKNASLKARLKKLNDVASRSYDNIKSTDSSAFLSKNLQSGGQ